ncbi:YHS domain-containing (seleno)protein [Amorphus sp. 3PC139-8]|uniref:YHS domain-containing (seleno)protein n=1 Tax=Amorphus sp. 3PC139-8 TaxID=2735676 RepID=UPI00345DEC16
MKTGRFALVVLAGLTLMGLAARAGEQYVDGSGFAVSGYDVVAYRDLAQAPVGASQPEAVPGRADITASYNGATFAFATEANRDRFLADPARYIPAYDGHCAYGVAVRGKVPGNPNLWRIVDGTLYLNISPDIVRRWERDIDGNLAKAETNWTALEARPASDMAVPALQPKQAPTKR